MEELQLDAIRKQTKDVLRELMEKADLKQGQILVVGCSSSCLLYTSDAADEL